MNAFYEHHKDHIRFHYRCFGRILLNDHRRSRRPRNPAPIDAHYYTIRAEMCAVFQELGIAA